MAVTFSPNPIVASINLGASGQKNVEIDFGTALLAAATVTLDPASFSTANGGMFSVSPATLAPGHQRYTITLTYGNGVPGKHRGTLRVTVGSATGPAPTTATSASIGPAERTYGVPFSVEVVAPAPALDALAEKHWLVEVPNYGESDFAIPIGSDGNFEQKRREAEMTAFLRLGAFDITREPPRGLELLQVAAATTSSTNPNRAASALKIHDTLESGTVFADDIRDRAQDKGLTVADDPDHQLTKAQRQAESSLLYKRGGWRDHSDGNRISTTYGDKVEVVRGNYKVVVLGRQDNTEQAMGWDVGGAHVQDYAPGTMPGASFWLEWIDDDRYHAPDFKSLKKSNGDDDLDADLDPKWIKTGTTSTVASGDDKVKTGPFASQKGVWLLVNTTENVYEYARKAGNFREEMWGDVHESYVGSETPPATGAWGDSLTAGAGGHEPPERLAGRNYDHPHTAANRITPPWKADNVGQIRSNPHIIEKTWAAQIDSFTGTAACPVPKITESTFADYVYENTGSEGHRIKKVTARTYVDEVDEKEYGDKKDSYSKIDHVTEQDYGISRASHTAVAATIAEATEASTIFESTICATHWELHGSALHMNIEVGGVVDIFLGAKFEFDLAKVWELSVIKHVELKSHDDNTALIAIRNYLGYQNRILSSQTTTMSYKRNALQQRLNALSTDIGI